MSFNNLLYDSCNYRERLNESASVLDYTLYKGKYDNTSKCRNQFGLVGERYGDSQYSGNLTDLESDLRGQTRMLSNCPSKKFIPPGRRYPLVNTRTCGYRDWADYKRRPAVYYDNSLIGRIRNFFGLY